MSNSALKIFVLDDDLLYRKMLVCYIESLGHRVTGFHSADECLENLNQNPDVVLLDHNLEGEQKGVDVLRYIKHERPNIAAIYVTGEENVALVSDVFRSGSEDFIGKDSASLLRLKLKLEDLVTRKSEKASKSKRNKYLLIGGAALVAIYVMIQLFVR